MRRLLKPTLFLLCSLPLAWLAARAFGVAGLGLGANPVDELMDRPLPESDRAAVEGVLTRFAPRLVAWHDLRTRRSGPARFVQVRLVLPGGLALSEAHAIAHEVEDAIAAALPGVDVLVHVDAGTGRSDDGV